MEYGWDIFVNSSTWVKMMRMPTMDPEPAEIDPVLLFYLALPYTVMCISK